jgi:hypothetical protein
MRDLRTPEQARAFAQLRALAAPLRLRVMADREGFPIIPGRYGRIEWTGGPELAVYCDRPRLFAKLWAIHGVRRHQTGDDEMRAMFPPEALAQVAKVTKARRRRHRPTPAPMAGLTPRHRATSGR